LPLVASAVAAVAGLLRAATPAPLQVVLTLQDPTLLESSGLAVSATHPGVLWTHNDGGSVAQVMAVDRHGSTVATVTLAGIDPYDPEALAPGTDDRSRAALYLGDIGDNLRERPDVSVFRFREPTRLADATVPAQWYRFTYPDGPHDAEALLVDADGRIMVATKEFAGAALYRAPRTLVTEGRGTNVLTRLAGVPSLVTDGAYLPDGRFVLRTYTSVYLYDRPGHEVARASLPPQPQGESVAADDNRLLVGSEGVRSTVLAVPVPAPAPAAPSAAPSPSATPARSASEPGSDGASGVTWVFGLLGLAVLLGLVVVARRRQATGSIR
jgi:MYXO-CTERM domain-containing protein